MRFATYALVVATSLLAASAASAQTGGTQSDSTARAKGAAQPTKSATANGDVQVGPTRPSNASSLLMPLAGGANTALGYSYNRQSRVVQRDAASQALARQVEGDLAALRNAQDAYYAAHQTYATSLDQLKGFRNTSGATILLRDVSDLGWTADATLSSLPRSSFLAQVNRASNTP